MPQSIRCLYAHLLVTALVFAVPFLSRAAGFDGLPEAIVQQLQSPHQLPHGRYTAVGTWPADDPALKRDGGRMVLRDPSHDGMAWELRPPQLAPTDIPAPVATLFGPYLETTPGSYMAFFRIKLLAATIDESAAELDACVNNGHTILTSTNLPISELSLDRYVEVPLPMTYTGGKLECRIHWHGIAALRVDGVSLFRFEGGPLPALPRRVAQPQPSALPHDLDVAHETLPQNVFPQSAAPANKLWIVDAQSLPPDWQLCVATVQGIVNRTHPQIYCLHGAMDQHWLDSLQNRGFIDSTETISAHDLVTKFAASFTGVVITDPALPASKHVAAMIAGVRNMLAVSPRLADEIKLPQTAREDLRNRWKTSVAAYRWALDNLWPQMNHQVIACYWPGNVSSNDYFVENKIFIFWMAGEIDGAQAYARPAEEIKFGEDLLAKMPANTAVMGYPWAGKDVGIGEGPGVTLFAEFAKYLVGSVDSSNLSVHSGIPISRVVQKPAPTPPPLDSTKVYVSVIISDGDNLPVLTLHNFPQLWADPSRGKFPIGWTLSPSAATLLPDIVDSYYSTATPNDCFVAAVSGVGYTYPEAYGNRYLESQHAAVFDGFLEQTRIAMQRSDLQLAWVMNTPDDMSRRYARQIPQLRGIFADYGRHVTDYATGTTPIARHVGIFHAATDWQENVSRDEQIARTVDQLRRFTPQQRPAFIHYFIWNWGTDLPMIQEVLHRLGPQYVPVRPDHMSALYSQYVAQQQIIVAMPLDVWGLENVPLHLAGHATNTSETTLDVAWAITGWPDCTLIPGHMQIPAGSIAPLTITGIPVAGQIALHYTGPFGDRTAPIHMHVIPRNEIIGSLPGHAACDFQWQLQAAQLSRHSGQFVKDDQADTNEAWAALKGQTEPGFLIYGPYKETIPGNYIALFRIKRMDDGSGDLLTLDTTSSPPLTTLAELRLKAEQLPVGQYRYVALPFSHSGGRLETRIQWPGNSSVSIDNVTLMRQKDVASSLPQKTIR